ncbi:MAG: hypothetical protein PVJ57_05935 [Phycisphaerae bacterium]|jgi:hypothetical protein
MSTARIAHVVLAAALLALITCTACDSNSPPKPAPGASSQQQATASAAAETPAPPATDNAPSASPTTTSAPTSSTEDATPTSAWLDDPDRRARFLSSRRRSPMMMGSFDAMVSFWLAVHDVPVSCETEEVAETEMWTNFPEFYQPTWTEYFNAVARQTYTHWYYKDARLGFMFVEPSLPLPFFLEVADGWEVENYGHWIKFVPPQAPVGMDVYMLGEYSAEPGEDEAALFERVRREWALSWAHMLDPQCTVDAMTTVQVDGADALFWEGQHPETHVILRQWVFLKHGMCFAIFTAMAPELEDAIWPDVQAMVKSFTVTIAPPTTQPADDDAGD